MINVLITGRGGFVGSALKARLEAFPERYRVASVTLRDDRWRQTGFAGWDCVVHAAAISKVSDDPAMAGAYLRVNRDLTLDVARRAKADGVRHFIFLSTMLVYGDVAPVGTRRLITPNTPVAPTNAYGRSKLEAEEGLRALADDAFRLAVLRPPMVYGEGCDGNYNTLSRLARTLPVFPKYDNRRGMVYLGNLVECLRLIIDGGDTGLFFPQDAAPVSMAELAATIARVHGRRLALVRALNPAVRLLGGVGPVRSAFGDLAYDPAMSARPEGYRRFDFETSIRRTEAYNVR